MTANIRSEGECRSCEGIELLLVVVEVELAGDGGGDEGRAVFAEEGDGMR
jgi:hypothetical protein